MKKLSILLLAVVGLGMTVTSCSKEDDKDKTPAVSAVGKWEMTSLEGTVDGQALPAGTEDFFFNDSEGCPGKKAYYQFDASGTFKQGLYLSQYNCELREATAAYTIASGNTSFSINFTDKDGNPQTITSQITSLTATQMKWHETGSFELDGETHTYDVTHVMTKK